MSAVFLTLKTKTSVAWSPGPRLQTLPRPDCIFNILKHLAPNKLYFLSDTKPWLTLCSDTDVHWMLRGTRLQTGPELITVIRKNFVLWHSLDSVLAFRPGCICSAHSAEDEWCLEAKPQCFERNLTSLLWQAGVISKRSHLSWFHLTCLLRVGWKE